MSDTEDTNGNVSNRVLVSYKYRSGDDENYGKKTLKVSEDQEPYEAVHEFFEDYWGKDTSTEDNNSRPSNGEVGTLYSGNLRYPTIEIQGIETLTEKEAEVFEDHGI